MSDLSADAITEELLREVSQHLQEGPYVGYGYTCKPQLAPSARPAVHALVSRFLRPDQGLLEGAP